MDIADIKTAGEAAALSRQLGVKLQVMRVRALTLKEISDSMHERLDTNQTQILLLELQLAEVSRRMGEIDVLEQLAAKKAAQLADPPKDIVLGNLDEPDADPPEPPAAA